MKGTAAHSAPRGLYDPTYEDDACGVAFVAHLHAPASYEVVRRAIVALEHLEHRGGQGADPATGDGAGILLQLPDAIMRAVTEFELPELYGVGVCFLPRADGDRATAVEAIERAVEAQGQRVVGWRDVPVEESACGEGALRTARHIAHVFVGAGENVAG